MIIPIGNESDSVRRLPWITFTIMAACLLVHIIVNSKVSGMEKELTISAQTYLAYYISHPYLQMDPELKTLFFSYEGAQSELESLLASQGKEEPYDYIKEEEQTELDEMGQNFLTILKSHPLRKWGFTPAHKTLLTQFTSMFLHVDWWHLIFNMLFLYISAPFIEDAWGRPIFAVFYVLMGLVSAQAHAMYYPASTVPLVGASGAVAGVMGAFLVRFWNVKIKFIYFFSFIFRGTFSAPAWLMLPLWVIEEFVSAKFSDAATSYGGGGGVAHWVHVWGFVIGFLVAVAIKLLKIEEKFIAPKILAETTYVNETLSIYEKAMDAKAAGAKEEAYNMLMDAAQKDPRNTEVISALWPLGMELEKKDEVAPFLQRQVDALVRQGQVEAAFLYFAQLREYIPGTRFSLLTSIILLQQMVKEEHYEEAEKFALEIGADINISAAPGVLLDFCNVLSRIDLERDRTHAQKFIQMALKHPDIPDSAKEELKNRVFEKPAQPRAVIDPISAGGAAAIAMTVGATKKPTASFATPPPPPLPDDMAGGSMFSLDQFKEEPPPPPPFPEHMRVMDVPPPPPEDRGSGPMFTLDQFTEEPPPPPPFPVNMRAMDVQPPPIPEAMAMADVQPPPIPGFPKPPDSVPETTASLFTLDFSAMPEPPKPPAFAQQIIIKPTFAAPLEIKDGRISLDVDGVGQRALPFQKVKAMAVVKIAATGQNAFLLVDLFLDEPNTQAASNPKAPVVDVRSLRITSNRFNPSKLMPNAKSTGEAFRAFVTGLQRLSGAVPYPDLETVQLKKILTFPSIEVYEDGLFNEGESQ